jgi:cytochrome c nitrite reductase small subunit
LVLYSSLAVAVLIGLVIGLGSFTFVYAKGYSYLQDDPAVCANCHVMQDHYSAWLRSSHRNVATCNDCHTPHDSVISKYIVKGKNGFWHSFYFTTGTYPDPIRITPGNRTVTEGACRYCHGALVEAMDGGHHGADDVSCIRCHATVGHDPNR